MRLSSPVRLALLVAWLCVWLGASAVTAAESSLTADFDGDGEHDQVTLDVREPSLLHVWLSATGTTLTIRTSSPVLCIAARDLDGDHRAELIGRDSASRLHVWTNKRRGFRAFRPHRVLPGTLARPGRRAWDDGPTSDSSAISWAGAPMLALALTASPRGPTTPAGDALTIRTQTTLSARLLAPLAPRPPPVPV